MNHTQRVSQDEGMTLIELLVVIFIISVLAGMMMPVMWAARQPAVTTFCVSNMRQVLLGLQLYMENWDEIPLDHGGLVIEDGEVVVPGILWAEAVLPYVGDARAFLCLADPDRGESPARRRGIPVSWNYSYNVVSLDAYGGQGRSVAPESPVLVCHHHAPTQRVLVIGRKDTSVEVAPPGKYAAIHVVFE